MCQSSTTVFVPCACFYICFQASHYLKDNSGISLNLHAVYLKHLFSNFQIICSRRKIIYTFYLFGGKTERNNVCQRKHWKFNIAIKGIYFFIFVYDNRPRHFFCLPFSGPCSQDFLAFSLSRAKELFFMPLQEFVVHFKKVPCSVALLKQGMLGMWESRVTQPLTSLRFKKSESR